MDPGGSSGIAAGEQLVRAVGAELVVDRAPALACPRLRSRWKAELCEGRAQAEPCPSRDHRHTAVGEYLVDRLVGERAVLAHRDIAVERDDADEARRVRGRCR